MLHMRGLLADCFAYDSPQKHYYLDYFQIIMMNINHPTPIEKKFRDLATEATQLLAAHDASINALAAFQKNHAKDNETQMHPAEFSFHFIANWGRAQLSE